MILISDIENYIQNSIDRLLDDEGAKMFNYFQTVLDDSELTKFMKDEFSGEKNTGLFLVIPRYDGSGSEDAFLFQTRLMIFFVDKTDFSEHDHASYIQIFKDVQVKVNAFIDLMIEQKSDGKYCEVLSFLEERSLSVNPVWKKSGCNGFVMEFVL
ncbi:hypothetical protein SAMN05216480_10548 [Pustulibacterium marinum]|uniref:Uncharacterized protein n=1 Tax=Pustulibacterium marinum TaxID=1224947 RepID=A0A1I7GL33_9FLAO|nr:hypothetical protein [Pustulibacterium marinum]SFU49153.1 hypothetical protein SAMN05216480_10548 [Pustulibacterium marinum]